MAAPSSRRDLLRAFFAGCVGFGLTPAAALPRGQRPERETLIRRGRVVNADGTRDADVRIQGEIIAEIGSELRPGRDARIIEAAGRLLIPGGIDPHTHLHPPFADDLTTGSQAALAGGITTVGTFAFPGEGESVLDALDHLRRCAAAEAIADVLMHASSWPPTPQMIGAIPALTERGHPSLKLYMPEEDFHPQLAGVIALLEAARAAGVVTLVHCEDSAILAAMARRLASANRGSLDQYGESRPVVAEEAATEQAVALCETTGAPMYAVHLSCARALDVCRKARRLKLPFYVETRPLYLHLTEEKLSGPDAPLFIGQPPLRSRSDAEALWAGLADGSIDVLATDHAPWTRAQKLDPALTVSNLRPGVSDLQFMLPMFFSEGVRKRRLPLERFVATTSANPARIFGLYPYKGVIQERASADIVVWDPERVQTVRAEADLSRADYSVYEGWEVTGWPVLTMRRGEVVYEDGHVTGVAGSGRVVARRPWRGLEPITYGRQVH